MGGTIEEECYSDPLLDVITLYESGPRGPGWYYSLKFTDPPGPPKTKATQASYGPFKSCSDAMDHAEYWRPAT